MVTMTNPETGVKEKLTMEEISGFLPRGEMFWSKKFNQGIYLSELQKR
jgi:hypothetical protein